MTDTFRGELHNETGCVGVIHKADGGFIVRTPIPFASGHGPVAFGGRVFPKTAFQFIGSTAVSSSRRVCRYRLTAEV